MLRDNHLTYTRDAHTLTLFYDNSQLFIQQMAEGVVRFTTDIDHPSYAVVSNAVAITHWNLSYEEDKLVVEIPANTETRSDVITLHVGSGFLTDIYVNDQLVCQDYQGDSEKTDGLSEEQEQLLHLEGHKTDSSPQNGEKKAHQKVTKVLEPEDAIYGLGDKPGCLNKRGYAFENWNTDDPAPHVDSLHSLYKSIPFFLVLKEKGCYGILADNTYRTTFDFGKECDDYYFFEHENGALDYYFIAGETPAQIISRYVELTGHAKIPQKWLLGYHQSRWSYLSAEEVREVANQFRELDIPCDSIHLDIDYMDGFRVFTFDPERFPAPKSLADDLSHQGIKLISIVDPGVKKDEQYAVYQEGMEMNAFARGADGTVYENVVWPGDSVFPDFTREDVRAWWGKKIKILVDSGIRGIWNDMNEPASFRGPLPEDVRFHAGTHDEIHNIYGHLMAEAAYDGLRRYAPNRRPFVLTRACYAGSQRYCGGWTGDNHSIWAHIPLALEQMCNLGLCGMMMCGSDIGGFGSDATPELFIRFFQAAIFSPFFRSHSAMGTRRQEPWAFDDRTTDIIRKVIKLRYRFLPYLYDLAHECEKTGAPILRPLVYEYPNDKNVRNLSDEYLLGPQVLAAPVIEPGKTARAVYLPEGRWYDFYTNACYEGGQNILAEAPLDHVPLYIKAGALLPLADREIAYVEEMRPEDITLYVYQGTGSHIHYDDDGETLDYEKGIYKAVRYEQHDGIVTKTVLHDGYPAADPVIHPCFKNTYSVS